MILHFVSPCSILGAGSEEAHDSSSSLGTLRGAFYFIRYRSRYLGLDIKQILLYLMCRE